MLKHALQLILCKIKDVVFRQDVQTQKACTFAFRLNKEEKREEMSKQLHETGYFTIKLQRSLSLHKFMEQV